jgi:hypothetical protein
MNNEKPDLEGKLCPIDGTNLVLKNNGGWKYVTCEKCNAIYENLSKDGLIKEATRYLELLNELNKADEQKIAYRNSIIERGKQKGLI